MRYGSWSRKAYMHGPSPDSYWALSISGASALVKTPVRGDPSTIKVIPAYFAGVNSQAISLTRKSVSPSVPVVDEKLGQDAQTLPNSLLLVRHVLLSGS